MRFVAVTSLLLLLVPAARAAGQAVFRAGVDVVHFAVTVQDDDGAYVADLEAEDFRLREDGEEQTITYFARGVAPDDVRLPLHLGLLFDTSTSMEADLGDARTAAIKFLNALPHAIDMTLVDFDTEVRVARFGQADFPRLVERIRSRKPEGWTALYDALGVYLDGASVQDGQKILVLYTDGGDTRSNIDFGDAVDLVRASDVTIYAIGFLQNQSTFGRTELRMRLRKIAEEAGGRAFFPTSSDDIEDAYDSIVEEISARYMLGYVSTNDRADGTWRDVEIDIRESRPELKDLRIRARKGYYSIFREASR